MIRKILVAFDGSPPSEKAYAFGLDLAVRYAAELVVLSVARPPEPPEAVELEAVLEGATASYEKSFAGLREQAAARRATPRFEIRVGHPAEQIIHLANQEGADVIVMGHRGKSLIKRWLMGSISRRVVSYANCSVLIAR